MLLMHRIFTAAVITHTQKPFSSQYSCRDIQPGNIIKELCMFMLKYWHHKEEQKL